MTLDAAIATKTTVAAATRKAVAPPWVSAGTSRVLVVVGVVARAVVWFGVRAAVFKQRGGNGLPHEDARGQEYQETIHCDLKTRLTTTRCDQLSDDSLAGFDNIKASA